MIVQSFAIVNHPVRCRNPANLVKNQKALGRAHKAVGNVIWCFEMSATNVAEYFLTISATIGDKKAWVIYMSGSVKWGNHVYNLTPSQFHHGLRTEFVLTDLVPEFSGLAEINNTVELHYSMQFNVWSCYENITDICDTQLTCQGVNVYFSSENLPGVENLLRETDQSTIDSLHPWDLVMFMARFHRKKLPIDGFTVSSITRVAEALKCFSVMKDCRIIMFKLSTANMPNETKTVNDNKYDIETILKHCVSTFNNSRQFFEWMMSEVSKLKNNTL